MVESSSQNRDLPDWSDSDYRTQEPIRLAVLLSGSGSTLVNLAQRIEAGQLHARISVVIASNDHAYGLQRAKQFNLPTHVVCRKVYDSPATFSTALFGRIREAQADLVCLAGFLSLLEIPDDYARRVLNVHPALLPAFGGQGMYGRRVHQAVLDAGCKVSGCTVHFADQTYDTGPIMVQRCCEVDEDDTAETLAGRVAAEEAEAYPRAIELIQQGVVRIEAGRTYIS